MCELKINEQANSNVRIICTLKISKITFFDLSQTNTDVIEGTCDCSYSI